MRLGQTAPNFLTTLKYSGGYEEHIIAKRCRWRVNFFWLCENKCPQYNATDYIQLLREQAGGAYQLIMEDNPLPRSADGMSSSREGKYKERSDGAVFHSAIRRFIANCTWHGKGSDGGLTQVSPAGRLRLSVLAG
jgi:hypothetical protein